MKSIYSMTSPSLLPSLTLALGTKSIGAWSVLIRSTASPTCSRL